MACLKPAIELCVFNNDIGHATLGSGLTGGSEVSVNIVLLSKYERVRLSHQVTLQYAGR